MGGELPQGGVKTPDRYTDESSQARPPVKEALGLLLALAALASAPPESSAQARPQQPSPMVEHTRAHDRLKETSPPGRREKVGTGSLFLPEKIARKEKAPLFLHFHGPTWLAELAAERHGVAVLAFQLGSGSGVYGKAFAEPEAFAGLLKDAEAKAGVKFGPVGLTAWSAGYGAVRAILRSPAGYERVRFVLLLDALHAGYADGKPGPLESKLVADDLDVFVKFARDAAAGKKQMLVTHSEVFPGTFASTTETADYLLRELKVKRKAVLEWGPLGMQQLSDMRGGKFRLMGYAGNSAPDHVDHLHALPGFLKGVDWSE
jgi:hypothetical protein